MQAEWELCKENFQPLKRGRKEVCKQESKVCQKADIEAQRRAFWQELETYNGEDPLEVWIRFIKWTQTSFRSGGHQAELLPLLERCTRELQHIDKYKSDIRYLRIWIQYADCLPEPRDVFNFLKENSIGQDFALYYLAYAAYMELRGNFSRADDIFQSGLERLAHPIDRLRIKYDDFQHRMAKRLERREAGLLDTPDDPVRSSLAVLSVQNKTSQQQTATAAAGGFALARPKRKAASNPGKENAGGLEVFVDDEFKAGRAGTKSSLAAPASGIWNKLGGFEQNRKENVQKASKWCDQKLPQKNTLVRPAIPILDIPVDEDIQKQPCPEHLHSVPKGTLRQRLERTAGSAMEERLLKDPLRYHKNKH